MANAGCINAYDCNGCLIQTLQNLDSACIGVGVQYTAPNPLDDKRLDYIKYTDKCGCVQCLSGENEILIYTTNGVIKNLTLTNDDVNEAIKIKWNEVFGSNRAKTIVRYKTGSYPVSITDGTLAVEETTKNQYSSTPFSLTGVLDETTYYISAFAVDSNGTIIDVQTKQITTSFQHTQIFDFTTGTQGWSITSTNGTYGHTVGQGFYLRYTGAVGAYIIAPLSIYDNRNLKKIILNYYLANDKHSCGACARDSDDCNFRYRYGRSTESYGDMRTYVGIAPNNHQSGPRQNIGVNLTGEIELVINFDSSSLATGTVNGTPFSISSSLVGHFITARTNKTLGANIIDWGSNENVYLRKATIITK